MTIDQILDPHFITNLVTVVITIVAVAYAIKQRAKAIISIFQSKEKDDKLLEKDVEVAEKDYELTLVAKSYADVVDILNLIVQASKMDAFDKTKVMELATQNKQVLKQLVEEKAERIQTLLQRANEIKDNPEQVSELLKQSASSVLDRYVQETNK